MSWIAIKMLVGDKAKFLGIVLGLTFAALLIAQQGSIFCGLMLRTCGQVTDITGVDLWVMDPSVRYVDDVKPMLENNLYRVRGVDGVRWAVPLYKGNARIKIIPTASHGNQPINFDLRLIDGLKDIAELPKTGSSEVIVARVNGALHFRIFDRDGNKAVDIDEKKLTGLARQLEAIRGQLADHWPPHDATWDEKAQIVAAVASLVGHTQATVIEQVILLGLDDATLVGAPPPERIVVGNLRDLRLPDAIFVDRDRLDKLYPKEDFSAAKKMGKAFYERFLFRQLEMNDHRAIIVGVCEATRTFQTNPVVYTTYTRAKNFAPQERKILSYVLARTEPGQTPDAVARRIAEETGLGAKTSDEFAEMTIKYYLRYTGIPINFGITGMLGFLVGTAIAGQMFYNFTLENLKQFGALKAMGATNLRIVGMILLQALVVGLLGYGIGVGLAALFGWRVANTELAFYTWWPILPIAAGAIVLICILSSLLCIQRVIRLEPAIVFRG
jgi:putative ABC transport system permease protein